MYLEFTAPNVLMAGSLATVLTVVLFALAGLLSMIDGSAPRPIPAEGRRARTSADGPPGLVASRGG